MTSGKITCCGYVEAPLSISVSLSSGVHAVRLYADKGGLGCLLCKVKIQL